MNHYNRIQGRGLERLALSNQVFAVAMTLLELDRRIPTAGQVHGERGRLRALGALGLQRVTYGHGLSHAERLLGWPAGRAEPHPRRIARPDLDSSRHSVHDHFVAAVHAPAGVIDDLPGRPRPLLVYSIFWPRV